MESLPLVPGEVLFVPSGGKSGMPKLAAALRAIKVNVAVSPDLDVLNEESLVKRLVEAAEGNWQDFEFDYAQATTTFRSARSPATCGDVLSAVQATFGGREAEAFDKAQQQELRAQIRTQESPWKALKDYGDRAFKGQTGPASERLMAALDALGVVLVRVGELEGFARTLQESKGPAWLAAALQHEAYKGEEVIAHVRRLVAIAK